MTDTVDNNRLSGILLPSAIKIGLFTMLLLLPFRGVIQFTSNVSIIMIIGIFTGILWVAKVILDTEIRKPATFHVLFTLFILWVSISAFWSADELTSFSAFFQYLSLLLITLIFWDSCREISNIRIWLQAYIFGQYIAVVGVLLNALSGVLYSSGRYTVFGQNPNIISAEIALGVPMAMILLSEHWRDYMSSVFYFNILFLILASLAVILTGSRQGLLALSATIIPAYLVIMYEAKPRIKFILTIFPVVIGLLVVLIAPSETLARYGTTVDGLVDLDNSSISDDLPVGTRFERIRLGIELFKQDPLLGVGAGNYPVAVESEFGGRTPSDNTFVTILANLGIIGFGLFISIIFDVARHTRGSSLTEGIILFGLILGWVVVAFFNNQQYSILSVFIFVMVLAHTQS